MTPTAAGPWSPSAWSTLSATPPSASFHVAGTKPVEDRKSGWVKRPDASTASKPKRPRSHSQLWFTGPESTPR